MGYPDNCSRCGESYDSDNLLTCRQCGSDVCYRCFGCVPGRCISCSPDTPEAPVAAGVSPSPLCGVVARELPAPSAPFTLRS